jgi:hypothetical protein
VDHVDVDHHSTKAVVLLHIPLMLPGMSLPPKELCGHQQWGAATDLAPGICFTWNFPQKMPF